jgi:hypothetical protein
MKAIMWCFRAETRPFIFGTTYRDMSTEDRMHDSDNQDAEYSIHIDISRTDVVRFRVLLVHITRSSEDQPCVSWILTRRITKAPCSNHGGKYVVQLVDEGAVFTEDKRLGLSM